MLQTLNQKGLFVCEILEESRSWNHTTSVLRQPFGLGLDNNNREQLSRSKIIFRLALAFPIIFNILFLEGHEGNVQEDHIREHQFNAPNRGYLVSLPYFKDQQETFVESFHRCHSIKLNKCCFVCCNVKVLKFEAAISSFLYCFHLSEEFWKPSVTSLGPSASKQSVSWRASTITRKSLLGEESSS